MGSRILAVFAIVFVGIAFGLVAVVVFLTRGKSEFWVDKKLRVGGMLLTLSSIIGGASGCGVFQPTCYDTARPPEQGEPEVMCYDVAYEPYRFDLKTISNNPTLTLTGEKQGEDGKFFYKLTPKDSDVEFAKGAIEMDTTGKFTIATGKKATPGSYELHLTEGALDGDNSQYVTTITFAIKDDNKQ